MSLKSTSGDRKMFDALESRQLLAPTITAFDAVPTNVINQLDSVSLQVTVTATEGVRAVTFFRDIDNNGRWSPGTDVDLGAVFTPSAPDTYSLTVSPDSGWTRNSQICADAVGNGGAWTVAGPTALALTVNRQPSVTSVTVSPATLNAGQAMTIRGRASDDAGIQLMRFVLDRNENGEYDAGTDTLLGDVTTPNGSGEYVLAINAGLDWPNSSQIIGDALDSNGTWSLSPTPIFVTIDNNVAPVIGVTSQSTSRSQSGEVMLFVSAAVTDPTGIRATTFFLDMDGNGRWTPNIDVSLETFFATGTSITRQNTFATDLSGRTSVSICVDAVDTAGNWRGAVVIGSATQPAAPQVTALWIEEQFPDVFEIVADAKGPGQYGASSTDIAEVQFFIDQNNNKAFDALTDRMLGGQTTFATLANGERRFTVIFDISSAPWDRNGVFAAVITTGTGTTFGTQLSSIRQATVRGTLGGVPLITSITTEVGINPGNGSTTFATPGTAVRVTANWSAVSGGRAVTFFFDRNNNGLWDPANDFDLGFRFVTGTSGTVNFTSAALPASVVGFGSIAAAVQDLSGRGADAWGPARTDSIRQIRGVPAVSNISAPPSTPLNSTLTFTARMRDDYGVRAGSAFLDINGNGLDAGDLRVTTFTRLSGNERDGVWQFSLNLTGLAAGTYSIYVAGVDFYTGHSSQPGGATSGLWGPRTAFSITVV